MRGRWSAWAERALDDVRAAGQWRRPRDFDAAGPAGTLDGRAVVSFASNDYLGLSQHPAVVSAAHAAIDRWGTGSGSARLVVGSRPCHADLERELADWKRCEAAVLFPTGFAANLGVLSTFAPAGTLVLSDELNHASIIDGCRLARATVKVVPHGDVDQVAKLLADHDGPAIVVTDVVFSMDGDLAPVDDLAEVCRRSGSLLVLDEAHAVLAPDPSFDDVEVVRVGTLSKTLGSLGGFVAAASPLVDLLVNRARSFIFTTASSPGDVEAARAALAVVRSAEGDALRARLGASIERVAPGHPSPIVPIVIGDEATTLAAAAELLAGGILVPAIRPPTVPAGSSRLRLTLSAIHTDEQVDRLLGGLDDVVPDWRSLRRA